jgi:hypothetical protein
MAEVIDFVLAVGFILVFVLVSWGIILQARDEQELWEDRKNYDKMREEVEKNDSSRIG